jgi:protein ImuA
MSGHLISPRREVRQTVQELRRHCGLFSFRNDIPPDQSVSRNVISPELGIRPGGIVECLVARQGAGALTAAMQIMAQSSTEGRGFWAVVDPAGEFYVPALSGWGVDSGRAMIIRPQTRAETCWTIEECLRCSGVSATWAWVDERIPVRVHRRWQLAAEAGGGVGLFFRPVSARRQPVWAELRLLVTPMAGAQEETRRLNIEVLYRRGGKGGSAQAWEIDHAAGLVHLVPEVAHSEVAMRKARA